MGAKVVTYLGSLIQWCCGDGGALQTNIPGVCSQCPGRTGFAPAHGVCAFPVYTAQAPGCSVCNCLRRALGCVRFPGLSRSGSGSQVLHKGADSVGPAFCALPRSKLLRFRFLGTPTKAQTRLGQHFVPFPGPSSSGDQVLSEHSAPQVWCVLSPPPSQPLDLLGGSRPARLRWAVCLFWGADLWLRPSQRMSTAQNPNKSRLANGSLLAVL